MRLLKIYDSKQTRFQNHCYLLGNDVIHKVSNHMDEDALSYAQSEQEEHDKQLIKAAEKRLHRRFSCAVKVAIEIPFLPTMKFTARDFSKDGMFLKFKDKTAAQRALEDNLVGTGSELIMRFAVALYGKRHQCRVQAHIVRVTQDGIGITFGDRTPWPLMELVDLFARAFPEADAGKA